MDALAVTQTIFYGVASLVLIVLGALLIVAVFRILGILKDARDVVKDVKSVYSKTKNVVGKFFGAMRSKKQ